MACGKPVITTCEGPAREFCPADCSYLISARNVPVPEGISGIGEFVSEPTWLEPDVDELTRAMRTVFENRAQAAERGTRAGKLIRRDYDWRCVSAMYMDRIAALAGHSLKMAAPALQASD
jgi:glycosyltransferase involved in cell wall biosynthesis